MNILSIAEYNPFFIKKTFNLPEYKPKQKKRVIVEYDNLFYELFNTMNKDMIHIENISKFNEKQEKIKIAAEIEKIKLNMKPKEKELVIHNLMYENKINLKTLNALCMFYKINLLYVKDNIFITMYFRSDGSDNYFMVNDKINEIDFHSLELNKKHNVTLDKPLRCASYYKVDDLRLISEQLHLPTENIKKQQLYDSIYNVLSKLNI
jgi:hypothetical protein